MPFFLLLDRFIHSLFRSQHQLVLENLALRQQVVMLRKSVKKPRPSVADKLFWIIFSRYVVGPVPTKLCKTAKFSIRACFKC
jgi:hypothetical protein